MRLNKGVDYKVIRRTDSTSKVEKEIGKYPILGEDEEKELLRAYAETKDPKIRDRIVEGNLRFVYSAAKAFSHNSDLVLDLYIEGLMGLMDALETFDITKDVKFMSYANEWVRKRMSMFIDSNKKIKRWCERKYGPKVNKERAIFFQENGRDPNKDELLEILQAKYNYHDIKDSSLLEKFTFNSINDTSIDGEQTFEESEDFNSHTATENDYMRVIEIESIREKVDKALCMLSERDREIMKLLYGIGTEDGEPVLPEVIGEMYGIGAARVNQIRIHSLEKLRKFKKYVA